MLKSLSLTYYGILQNSYSPVYVESILVYVSILGSSVDAAMEILNKVDSVGYSTHKPTNCLLKPEGSHILIYKSWPTVEASDGSEMDVFIINPPHPKVLFNKFQDIVNKALRAYYEEGCWV